MQRACPIVWALEVSQAKSLIESHAIWWVKLFLNPQILERLDWKDLTDDFDDVTEGVFSTLLERGSGTHIYSRLIRCRSDSACAPSFRRSVNSLTKWYD